MPIFPNFCGPSYRSQSPRADVERCINLYPEVMESPSAKTPQTLYGIPGLQTIASVNEAPGRALFAQDGLIFGVVGFAFYQFTYNDVTDIWTATLRGTVDNNGLPATISSSGDAGGELFITAGGKGYSYNIGTTTLTEELGSGSDVGGYQNGYFLSLDIANSAVRISDLLDGTTWDPSQVALRTAAPDKWEGMIVVNQDVWLLGSETSEMWRDFGTDSPAYPFVFAPVPGALIEQGIGATYSASKVDQAPVWFSRNPQGQGMVLRGNGYGVPTRISNHAVEFAIQRYTTVDDAVSFSYQDEGHTFFVLTFPTANATWVFDTATGVWHERLRWDVASATWEAYRPLYHAFAFGQHLVLDRSTGTLYRMRPTVFTDAGATALRRERQVPFPSLTSERVFLSAFLLQVQVGVGLSTGQGSDPQVMLRISRDGGLTWGPEMWHTLGAIGQYLTRVVWYRLGMLRGNLGVLRVTVTDPVPVRIIGAEFDATQGLS